MTKRDVGVGGALGPASSLDRHSGPHTGMSPVGGYRVLTAALRRTAIFHLPRRVFESHRLASDSSDPLTRVGTVGLTGQTQGLCESSWLSLSVSHWSSPGAEHDSGGPGRCPWHSRARPWPRVCSCPHHLGMRTSTSFRVLRGSMRSALHGRGVQGFVDLCEAGRTDLAVLCRAQGWGLEERNICAVFARPVI